MLILLSVLGACTPQPETLSPLATDATILAFGDSLTAGTGAATGSSYPTQLAALSGRQVINAGVPGELSSQGLARLPSVLDEHQPHLLILTHGGNDMLRRMDVEQTRNNLSAMIQLARERGMEVLLVAVPAPTVLRLRSEAIYGEIAEAFGIPVENGALARILSRDAMKSDPIHPNADGYRYLAEHIHRLLMETGAL
ncbi:arylesterase [Thioalkalivibrio sp.]|uniref:arylesterase n=1 Tax=Thioalkalivibrio sp. TaxID=2093813 RepID=UPI00397678C4